jgi:HlyD family secretion protein
MAATMSRKLLPALLWSIGLFVVVFAGVFGWRWYEAKAAMPPVYESAEVVRTDIRKLVTASGTLSPRVTVEVGSQVSGRIAEILVDFNTEVKEGQVVARLDTELLEADIAKAKASLKVAQASLQRAQSEAAVAKSERARTDKLVDQGILSRTEQETIAAADLSAKANVASARATLSQAQAALEQAQTNLRYAVILSPIDGVVISRDVDIGQTLAASMTPPILFTIAEDLRKMEVHTSVAEADVGQVGAGMKVEFTVDAHPGKTFDGVVKEVRFSPTTVQNVVTYDAVVSIENPELQLRPGMTAQVSFIAEERKGVLAVPNAALRFRPPVAADEDDADAPAPSDGKRDTKRAGSGRGRERAGRSRTVYVHVDGRIEERSIEVGLADERATEVVAGQLAEGEWVVTGIETPPGAEGEAKAAAAAQGPRPQGQQQRRMGGRGGFL